MTSHDDSDSGKPYRRLRLAQRLAKSALAGKPFYTLGCLVAVLVWYLGFAVIGGEYFAMWASQWNGQMKSYAFVGFILLSLVYVSQAEEADPTDDRGWPGGKGLANRG